MNNKSFTLIELLVVIVIIGILAGVIMISTSSSISKANLAKAQAFSSNMQNSMFSNIAGSWKFDELGNNVLLNSNFNSDFTSGIANSWSSSGTGTFTEETSIVRSGSAQKIVATNNGQIRQNITLMAGKTYKFTAWIYVISALSDNPRISLYTYQSFSGDKTLVGKWQQMTGLYTVTTTQSYTLYVGMLISGSTGTYIIDDVSVEELDIKDEAGVNSGIVGCYGTPCTYPEYHDKNSNNCVNGGCFKFYGDDTGTIYNYINIPLSNSLKLKRSITLSAWGKFTGNATSSFVASDRYILNMDSGRKLYFNIYNGAWSATTYAQAVSADFISNWHFYVATYDYDTGFVKLYIDGEIQTLTTGLKENSVGQVEASDPTDFRIGKMWDWDMDGYIDEVGVYNKSLSQAKIKQDYIAGLDSLLSNGNISKEDYNERINELAYEK